ncbi:MAG: hypothetical protein NVS9B7_27740 [Flavisolibacter sp.]
MITDREGNLIAIKNKIVIIFKNKKTLELPLEYYVDNAILTKDDFLWVITRSKKLYKFRISPFNLNHYIELLHVFNKELPEVEPRSLAIDGRNHIWIGTRNHGLYCYSSDGSKLFFIKKFGLKEGLTENFTHYLYCDDSDQLWVCSNGGLDKISYKNEKFSVENITRSVNWNLNILKVQQDSKGLIWGLTSTGILKIFPQKINESSYIPKIQFTRVNIENKDLNTKKNGLKLSYLENSLFFHLSIPSFFDESAIRFTYKLEGSPGAVWSEPSSLADLNFIGLPPGRYLLEVKGYFINERYPPQYLSYSFLILPPWWQSWWFRVIEFIGILTIVIYLVRSYYWGKLQKDRSTMEKQKAIEKERTRIATDMHDDLGSGLTKIAILSEVVKAQLGEPAKAAVQLDKISESSRKLANNLQDIIWVLNPGNVTVESLSAYIREFALKFFDSTGVVPKFDYPDPVPPAVLREEVMRTIFLVVKETLNNTAKYAFSPTVNIRLIVMKQEFQIVIEDEGRGFDQAKVREFAHGLSNMKLRMREINGSYEISSSLNRGTKTIIKAPI